MIDLNKFGSEAVASNIRKGFNVKFLKKKDFYELFELKYYLATKIALIHSEASEMLEALRDKDIDHMVEEGIDVLIRTIEFLSCIDGVDIEKELLKKHEFNKTRLPKHGGKLI